MVEPEERLRQNRALFRRANDRLRERVQEFPEEVPAIPFLCECVDETCLGRIDLTIAQYEDVRAVPHRYVVLPGHAGPERELVVEDRGDFHVVEKDG
jgi:hypothetical protein